MRRPRLVYLATHPVTADLLLRGQLAFMREHGFDVTVIAAPGPELDRVRDREGVQTIGVPMVRVNDAPRDAVSLARLTAVLRRLRPDIVNAGTPKAGLLGMMAARALDVPVRIYLLRGLRLETARGALRRVLAITERVASACAHEVVAVSRSLVQAAVEGGYVPSTKAIVLGAGASNGIETERFRRTEALRLEGGRLLAPLGVGPEDPVIGFVGRLVADKGIDELLGAFERVRRDMPRTKLVLLGGDLAGDTTEAHILARVRRTPGVIATKKIADLAPYYARLDVLGFPSYREGFPNVVAEAASAELPVVGFRVTGVVDAVEDGKTGALVERGNVEALADALATYLREPARAAAHGRAARERVVRLYDRRIVWKNWLEHYRDRLERRNLPLPVS